MSDYLYEDDTYKIIGALIEVHKNLGKGFSEIVYKDAFEYELKKINFSFEREKEYLVHYKDVNGSVQTILAPQVASVQTVTSSATVTPTSTNDLVIITAQAVGLTLANPTGTFTEGQALMIRIKDNGTARTIAFDTNYRAIGVTLPTTTVISKTLYLGIIYNATDGKWDVVGTPQQA